MLYDAYPAHDGFPALKDKPLTYQNVIDYLKEQGNFDRIEYEISPLNNGVPSIGIRAFLFKGRKKVGMIYGGAKIDLPEDRVETDPIPRDSKYRLDYDHMAMQMLEKFSPKPFEEFGKSNPVYVAGSALTPPF